MDVEDTVAHVSMFAIKFSHGFSGLRDPFLIGELRFLAFDSCVDKYGIVFTKIVLHDDRHVTARDTVCLHGNKFPSATVKIRQKIF